MKSVLLFLLLAIMNTSAYSKTIWSDFSVTYLSGNDYEVGDNEQDIITFEYASGTSWGDTFMFFDRSKSSNGDVSTYGEFAPRIKVVDFKSTLFNNIYFAPAIEMGPTTNYLFGVGTDVNIPTFKYFNLNFYLRNNEDGDESFQTTVTWAVPVGPLLYDGFMDYATSVKNTAFGDTETQVNLTSQLKYDIAPHIGLSTRLYLGLEYVYWKNKFGIDGIDEKNANLLVKYHF